MPINKYTQQIAGITITNPVYSINLPQTGFAYDIRGLTTSEMFAMRSSFQTKIQALISTNKTLFDCAIQRPPNVKTLEDFKKTTTVADRDSLFYALYIMTFGEIRDFSVTCSNSSCKQNQNIKLDLSKMLSFENYPYSTNLKESYKTSKALNKKTIDEEMEKIISLEKTLSTPPAGMPEHLARMEPRFKEYFEKLDKEREAAKKGNTKKNKNTAQQQELEELKIMEDLPVDNIEYNNNMSILNRKIRFKLPISNITVTYHAPTLEFEEDILQNLKYLDRQQVNLVQESMIISSIEQEEPDHSIIAVTNRNDILEIYNNIHINDRQALIKDYHENFGKYSLALRYNWHCNSCQQENLAELNISALFFRAVVELLASQ